MEARDIQRQTGSVMISADAITSRTFTTVRFKEGYSAREVDDFLDEIVDRMTTGDHSLARRIKEKTFSNVRFRGGTTSTKSTIFSMRCPEDWKVTRARARARAQPAQPQRFRIRMRPSHRSRARATRATRILRPLRPTATRRSCHGDGCAGVSLKDRGQPTSNRGAAVIPAGGGICRAVCVKLSVAETSDSNCNHFTCHS